MRNLNAKFVCYPSVVCVGKETEVMVFPRDTSRIFREEKEYEVGVVDLWADQLDYHDPVPLDHEWYLKNGCLCFKHTFDREQEYSIRFCEKGGKEERIKLFAADEDLYGLRPLKGDLHSHSYYSDGQDGVTVVPADYREEGFDFYALTDHNRMYPAKLQAELYKDIPLGIHMMRGEEVHTPGSLLHLVHAGGAESVCDYYIHHREEYEAEVDAIAATLPEIPEQYRRRYAMAKWACERIHAVGGVAIYAHPYWCPNRNNLSDEFIQLLFDSKMFDAFEVLGGSNDRTNNMQVALWQDQMMQGNTLAPVGSSDSHNHDFMQNKNFARRVTIAFAKANTTEAILEAIKAGNTLAAEVTEGSQYNVQFYGSLRLVRFARFLWDHYFAETWRLCYGEGVLMRRYAEGEDVGALLGAMAGTVEEFYQKFYGLKPFEGIPADRKAHLDHCLEVQRTVGPITKGSNLYIYGGNERRE